MIKTHHSGSYRPLQLIKELNGDLVATSYKSTTQGNIEFYHIKRKKMVEMSSRQFYLTHTIEQVGL
ncbi:hypothetical protein [Psychrobacter sp. I-STPA6b]|uniref:hypothetical protein n=1 Tax=Psychrobacter sp. I-STPA6b TaxID=2585718 RepID=UPI001D0C041C|nr:hypothetical protein [Psychrobacter sp. I-STPA6b]